MKSFIAAITALAVSTAVSAQQAILSVTNPINGTVFTAGKPALITWSQPTVDVITQIVLAHGDPSNLQQNGPIASNINAASMSYTWNIPADTAQGTYALIFGTSPNLAYSPQFIIQPADGASSAASAAPSSTSAAISSASTSAPVASSSVASATISVSSSSLPSAAVSSTSVHVSSPSATHSSGSSTSGAAPFYHQPAAVVALGMGVVAAVAVIL